MNFLNEGSKRFGSGYGRLISLDVRRETANDGIANLYVIGFFMERDENEQLVYHHVLGSRTLDLLASTCMITPAAILFYPSYYRIQWRAAGGRGWVRDISLIPSPTPLNSIATPPSNSLM